MLSNLSPSNAANRTSSKPLITVAAFKAAVSIGIDDSEDQGKDNLRWFWEIFEEMNKQDRSLVLKFMSGDSRIKEGHRYTIDYGGNAGLFPEGHTCGSSMTMPYFESKE